MTTLCLNMIVKNEVANLERCLASVADHVSCWVIGDTGSTDGTQDMIRRFFDARGIPGELHSFPFENFGHARNAALDLARASAMSFDYLLFADADMELTVTDPGFARSLTAEVYQLRQDSGVAYWNTRLLRRDAQARYVGVTHEYLDLRAGETLQLDGVAYVDHASGANRPGKFARDAALLSRALETEPDPGLRARYTFYLGNSLRDDGDQAGALACFLERSRLGHWPEEVFVSLLNAAEMKLALGHPTDAVLAAFEEASAACTTRAEALHGAARLCRDKALHERGYQFAARGVGIPLPRSGLFVAEWIYAYGLFDELAVAAYWSGRYEECRKACALILREGKIPHHMRERIEKNMRFALEKLGTTSVDASARSSPSNSISTWVPPRPLAGTELMMEALRDRMGAELDVVNLKVNLFDPATLDARPLVVWIHHDMNQAAVQWCRDKDLVARVARFVFISHWQRERFIAAFDLAPERCVVIRYAMDQTSDIRRWEPAPLLRCAYTSTPFRGLDVLLDAWDRLPAGKAELHVWSSMKLYVMDDGPYEHLLERARVTPGVVYHGLAPNHELRATLRTMHFLTYPSTFAETSCLSVMEAMAAGCRVIVPSYGALPETTGGYARIYRWCADTRQHADIFAETLADEIASPWRGRPDQALAQQSHCATVYAWSRCLDEWRALALALSATTPKIDCAASPEPAAYVAPTRTTNRVQACLAFLRDRGFAPRVIVDAGAYDGDFSRGARSIFPAAHLLMIDALAEKEPVLESVCRDLGNATSLIALLGEADFFETPFFVMDTIARPDLVMTGSSKFRENSAFPMQERTIPQRRLEGVLAERGLACDLIKLDVQGAELDVLRGLGPRLAEAEVIVMEMSLVEYNEGAPLVATVLGEIDAMGFALYEIVEEHRYRDGSLMQIDGVFVKKTSPLRPRGPFWF